MTDDEFEIVGFGGKSIDKLIKLTVNRFFLKRNKKSTKTMLMFDANFQLFSTE